MVWIYENDANIIFIRIIMLLFIKFYEYAVIECGPNSVLLTQKGIKCKLESQQ